MRTLFEDVNEKADREDDGATKSFTLITWVIAALMIAGAAGTYFWVAKRTGPVAQAPVVVSVDNDELVKKTLNEFGGHIIAGKWEEAEKMLSSEARAGLEKENKTLRDSFMADRFAQKKDDKVAQAFPMNIVHTASTARVDSGFIFADSEQTVRSITIVKEGDRLVINSW